MRKIILFIIGCMCLTSQAAVQTVEVKNRVVIPGYQGIPATEKLTGVVHFSFQTSNPYNMQIKDLDKGPLDMSQSLVAKANFVVLQALNPSKRTGTGIVEIVNNGKKSLLASLNLATGKATPASPTDLGDGFLQQQGMTLIWIGWQGNVKQQGDNLFAEIPSVLPQHNIKGLMRQDWVVNQPLSELTFSFDGVDDNYAPDSSSEKPAYLTRRKSRDGMRELVPKTEYDIQNNKIIAKQKFSGGYIYEFVYPVKNSAVSGLGMAMIRDLVAYAKYNNKARFKIEKAIGFGQQQGARLLKAFNYGGFNIAEDGRTVFDGMFIHGAGAGRGSFNQRFAQPQREAKRSESFFYPVDKFPFTSTSQVNPITGKSDSAAGKLDSNHRAKIFYTSVGNDYWNRSAAFTHTDLNASKDIALLSNERLYHFSAAQTKPVEPASFKVANDGKTVLGNNLNFHYYQRALLTSLNDWVKQGKQPLESMYPTFADNTLKHRDSSEPKPQTVYLQAMSGSEQDTLASSMMELTPAVPAKDEKGNPTGGIRHPILMLPIADFNAWSRVQSGFLKGEIAPDIASFVPYSADRLNRNFDDKDDYLRRIKLLATNQVTHGYLLQDDVNKVVADAAAFWDWIEGSAN